MAISPYALFIYIIYTKVSMIYTNDIQEKGVKMANKYYRLSDESVKKLHQIMEEKMIKTETAAIEFLIESYGGDEELAEKIVDTLFERDKAFRERIRWATRTAETNTYMLLDGLNTILLDRGNEYCSHIEVTMSPVLKQSQDKIKERLAHFKQEKDNRERKRREG